MKFEDFLMQRDEEHQKRLHLEEEVEELQGLLEREQKLSKILQCALQLQSPLVPCSCLSSPLANQVQVLLAEVAIVEDEISYLERRVEELKLCLYYERKQNGLSLHQQQQQHRSWQQQQRHFLCGLGGLEEFVQVKQPLMLPDGEVKYQRLRKERTPSLGSISEVISCTKMKDEGAQISRRFNERKQSQRYLNEHTSSETPNKLSEELIRNLISIFHKLNCTSPQLHCESSTVPKNNIACKNSRSFMSFNCKTTMYHSDEPTQMLDPYGMSLNSTGRSRDHGSYKKCVQFTRSSLDMSHIPYCFSAIERLRVVLQKLSMVEVGFLTYKQKLAFWINIYNGCIMHEFLQNGLPPSPDKLVALLNKAAVNVGGIVLNALAIEHYILRHSPDSENGVMDAKEELLRHAYGLGYPEPNVTFALCRGSWSSPALRVYTAENVVDELEKAKIEYLEASVGITSKKKIFIPKLMHWHMRDFADDIESLLEWIYSQLPRSGSLKRSIMQCLISEGKIPLTKMVEIQPYEAEFCYLLPI